MRIEFGFGVGFDRDKQSLPAEFVRKATKQILVKACELFGGCNLLNGQGAWINATGDLILEESRVLVIDTSGRMGGAEFGQDEDAKVAAMAEFIRAELRQEAVHVARLVATARDVSIRSR